MPAGACNKCGEEGHFQRECPLNPPGSGGGNTCRTCKQEGHFARDCPSKQPGDTACRSCKQEGHFSRDCPNKPEGVSSSACHKCQEEGHIARDCPNKAAGEPSVGPDGKPREHYTPAEFSEGDAIFEDRNATHCGTGINFNQYDSIPVKASGENVPEPITMFADLELRPLILENLKKCGYTKPTPIQRYAAPILASHRDIMACAQTGSGKSCAFLLPILNELMSDQDITPPSSSPATPEALILAPTRELAAQIGKESHMYGQGSIVKTRVCYGGTTTFAQRNQLLSGCNILVATPGRILQFLNEGHVSLAKLRFFILDEADRMLDMGFMGDVNKIVAMMPPKGTRVSGMFSATLPPAVQKTATDFLVDYIFVTVGIVGGACKDVLQEFLEVDRKEKRNKVIEIIKSFKDTDKILIFCGSKKGADFLATSLVTQKLSVTSIHGDRLQSQRELAIREFTRGDRRILVATAVAARGLDIPNVSVVINFDLPSEIEEYVHRIGRTGRVGNTGRAVSFFDVGQDMQLVPGLKQILVDAQQEVPDWMDTLGAQGYDLGGVNGFGGLDSRDGGGGSYVPAASANDDADEEENW